MKNPQITWFVRKPDDPAYSKFTQADSYYAGSYTQGNDMSIEFVIWNNRCGAEQCEDLSDFGISVSFMHLEDSSLLKYCSFIINNAYTIEPVYDGTTAVIQVPSSIVLSGAANDGTLSYNNNYIYLKLIVSIPDNETVKMNDLKTMCLNITKL